VGSQPIAHTRPRVGVSFFPGPYASGRNDENGQLFAVGHLDDPPQIGARGSKGREELRGCYGRRSPGDEAIVARCSPALDFLRARSATTPARRLRATGFGTWY
jgi:hypothetical protein